MNFLRTVRNISIAGIYGYAALHFRMDDLHIVSYTKTK